MIGSTLDPRLGAVSPAAIQALSQAGAATGQMYANLGGSIAGVIQDAKSRRDDSILQDAFSKSAEYDDDGKMSFNKETFYNETSGKKINSKVIDSFYKNKLATAVMETDMAIQKQLADYEGDKVDISRAAESRLSVLQDNQIELGNKELNLKAYEVLSNDYNRVAQLKLQRDQLAQAKEFKELDLGLVYKELNQKIKEADRAYVQKVAEFAKDNGLTQAQIGALGAEKLYKESQTALTDLESLSYEDPEGLMTNEAALINGAVDILRMEKSDFESLSPMERKALLDSRLRRIGEEGNPNAEDIQPLKKLSDFYLNRGLASMTDEEYAAYKQQQQQAPENLSYLAQADRFFANRASARQN